MEDTPSDSNLCPSCGQFLGPYDRCPYCGADVHRRLAVRALKYGSLVLALAGLAVLLLVARHSQVPLARIGDLAGTMNWAYLRVEGQVSRQPAYDPQAPSLHLWVWDGSGEIMVAAYGAEAQALLVGDHMPVMGDGVAVEGTLRVREDFQYLVVNAADRLETRPAEPVEMAIASVGRAPRYQRIALTGVVRGVRTPYEGLRILSLRDATGQIDLTLSADAASIGGPFPDVTVGQAVRIVGAADEYKGTPQLAVGRASDVQFVAEAPAIAPERDLGALAPGDVGRLYAVEGTISRVEAFSAGVKCLLDDASDTATLLLWQDLYDALPQRDALIAGAAVRVVGEVSEYQGEMEIVPELPSDVALLAPAEPLAASQRVAQIAPADVGRTVLVKGILTSLAPFSAGVKGTLDDGTGTITLLLWQDVYDGLADPATLSAGARLSVRGEIDQYLGEMEVVPQVAADVQIVEAAPVATVPPTPLPSPTREPAPTSTPPAEETAQPVVTQTPTAVPTPSPLPAPTFEVRMIGAITNADVGRTFTLDLAGIAGVGYLSRGVRFTVTDPTGSIVLLLWQDILEENPGRYDLFAGSQVRITGEIDEYEGELEIVPRKGADVTVVNRGERPPVEERPANGITAADEGRFLTVEGTVARLEGRQWMRVWLDDGTGQILIYVPERTMAYLSPGIGPGARLRVTGEVDVYQGEIEIVPLAGADVEVR